MGPVMPNSFLKASNTCASVSLNAIAYTNQIDKIDNPRAITNVMYDTRWLELLSLSGIVAIDKTANNSRSTNVAKIFNAYTISIYPLH